MTERKKRKILEEAQRAEVVKLVSIGRERGEVVSDIYQGLAKKFGVSKTTIHNIWLSATTKRKKRTTAPAKGRLTKAEKWLQQTVETPSIKVADIHGQQVKIELKKDGYLEIGTLKLNIKAAKNLGRFMADYFKAG